MERIVELQAKMQAAYAAWGKEPSAEAYHAYYSLRNELLRVLHLPLGESA